MNCVNCKHWDVCKFRSTLFISFIETYGREIKTENATLEASLFSALAENCKHYECK